MTTAPKSEASLFFPTERQGRLLKTSNTEKLNGVLLQIAFLGLKKKFQKATQMQRFAPCFYGR